MRLNLNSVGSRRAYWIHGDRMIPIGSTFPLLYIMYASPTLPFLLNTSFLKIKTEQSRLSLAPTPLSASFYKFRIIRRNNDIAINHLTWTLLTTLASKTSIPWILQGFHSNCCYFSTDRTLLGTCRCIQVRVSRASRLHIRSAA